MNGKTAKILRKYARIRKHSPEGMKFMWGEFDRVQKGKAKRFMLRVIAAAAAGADVVITPNPNGYAKA